MPKNTKSAVVSEAEQITQLLLRSGGTGELRTPDGKDIAAMILGRRGGLKGGPARAESLTKEQRREIARRAATVRWGKSSEQT